MTERNGGSAFDALVSRLQQHAAALAEAHAEAAALNRESDARRWRRPDLLWPLFSKGN